MDSEENALAKLQEKIKKLELEKENLELENKVLTDRSMEAEKFLEEMKFEKSMKCPICSNPYDHSEMRPKNLPCNIHTCCIGCVKLPDQLNVYCQLCNKEYYIKTSELKTNMIISGSLSMKKCDSRKIIGDIKTPIQISEDNENYCPDQTEHPSCTFHNSDSAHKICIKCFYTLCYDCADCHNECGKDMLKDVQEGIKIFEEIQIELSSAFEKTKSIQKDFIIALENLPSQTSRVSKEIKSFYSLCRRLLKKREKQMQEGHKNDSLCTEIRLKRGIDSLEGILSKMEQMINDPKKLSIHRFPGLANFQGIKDLISMANKFNVSMDSSTIPIWRRYRKNSMTNEDTTCNDDDVNTLINAKDAENHCLKFFIPKVSYYQHDFTMMLEKLGQHCSSDISPKHTTARSTFLNLVNNDCVVEVQTFDYKGEKKLTGGDDDAIEGLLKRPTGEEQNVQVKDNSNGTYTISFVPSMCGYYQLFLKVFGQSVQNMPLQIEVVNVAKTNELVLMDRDFPKFVNVCGIAADIGDDCLYILDREPDALKLYYMRLNGSRIGEFILDEKALEGIHHEEQVRIIRQFRKKEKYLLVLCSKQKKIYTLSADGKFVQDLDISMLCSSHTCSSDKQRIYIGDYAQQSIFVFNHSGIYEQINLEAEYNNGITVTQFKFKLPFLMTVSQEKDGDIFVIDNATNTLHQMNKRGFNMRFISLDVKEICAEAGINLNSICIENILNFQLGKDGVVIFLTSSGICTLKLLNARIEYFKDLKTEENACMGLTSNEYVVLNTKNELCIQKLTFID